MTALRLARMTCWHKRCADRFAVRRESRVGSAIEIARARVEPCVGKLVLAFLFYSASAGFAVHEATVPPAPALFE